MKVTFRKILEAILVLFSNEMAGSYQDEKSFSERRAEKKSRNLR